MPTLMGQTKPKPPKPVIHYAYLPKLRNLIHRRVDAEAATQNYIELKAENEE